MKLKRDWLSEEERLYVEYAARLIGDLKAQLGLDGRTLQSLLEEAGMPPIQPKTLTDKLRRGSYSFPFALHALAALGVTRIDIPPLPRDRFTVRVTWEAYGADIYPLPKHVQGVHHPGKLDVLGETGGPVLGRVELSRGAIHGLNKIFRPSRAGALFVIRLGQNLIEATLIDADEVNERWVWADPEDRARGR